MNTEENKLIAEFMGWKVDKSISSAHFKKTGGYHLTNGTRTMASDQLQYHTSWDWLMPVVEKIEELGSYTVMGTKCYHSIEFTRSNARLFFSPNQDFQLHLELRVGKIDRDTWRHPMYKAHIIKQFAFKENKRIGGLYAIVVEFIKWYNEQKK